MTVIEGACSFALQFELDTCGGTIGIAAMLWPVYRGHLTIKIITIYVIRHVTLWLSREIGDVMIIMIPSSRLGYIDVVVRSKGTPKTSQQLQRQGWLRLKVRALQTALKNWPGVTASLILRDDTVTLVPVLAWVSSVSGSECVFLKPTRKSVASSTVSRVSFSSTRSRTRKPTCAHCIWHDL